MMSWVRANCTFIWRTIFTIALTGVCAAVWNGGAQILKLSLTLESIPEAVHRIEAAVNNHETRISVLEALRERDSRGRP